jgi:hypothetical protein
MNNPDTHFQLKNQHKNLRNYTLFLALLITSNTWLYAQLKPVDPPRTIKLKENLFIDRMPVSNIMVIEFEVYKEIMKEEGFTEIRQYVSYMDKAKEEENPSSLKELNYYLKNYDTNEKLSDRDYYDKINFLNLPMLTMTAQQAADFCEWRTAMTKYRWLNDLQSLYKVEKSAKLKYRLASLKELEQAASTFQDQGLYHYINNTRIWKVRLDKDDKDYTLFSIYEFTNSDVVYKDHLNSDKEYDFTGFRCLCEYK